MIAADFLFIALAAAAAHQSPEHDRLTTVHRKSVATETMTPAVAGAVILPGRFESCAINPPLTLITQGTDAGQKNGNYVLSPSSAASTAVVVAYSSAGNKTANPVAYVLDELNVSAAGAQSSTGQTNKVFEQETSGTAVRLIPKAGDYSVCRYAVPVSSKAVSMVRSSRAMAHAHTNAAYASILDIFGLEEGVSVRLRLSSTPTNADIFINDFRQNAHTDTVLDVERADVPNIVLEKAGFVPCTFREWRTSIERGPRPILDATCTLRHGRGRKTK